MANNRIKDLPVLKTAGDIDGDEYLVVDKEGWTEAARLPVSDAKEYFTPDAATEEQLLNSSSNEVFATPMALKKHTIVTKIFLYTNFGI